MSALAPTYTQFPFQIERGEGCYVFDENGKRYLDLYGGHAVSILGHSPSCLKHALAEQAQTLSFYSNVAASSIRELAAKKLLDFTNNTFASVFFCNSGAEANENALKLALQITGRKKIISLRGGFHGRSLLCSLATDNPAWHTAWPELRERFIFLEANDLNALTAIDESTAAIIVEPIQSIAGVVELDTIYLKALRQAANNTGALLIFDEVQTGVGRLGVPYVACEAVKPDMSTSAKSLAGGFPIGALLLTKALSEKLKLGDLGSTFGGGQLACAALIATLAEIESKKLMQNAINIEHTLREVLIHPAIKSIRGRGALVGIELTMQAKEVHIALLESGYITGTCANPLVLRLLPPLTISQAELINFSESLLSILD